MRTDTLSKTTLLSALALVSLSVACLSAQAQTSMEFNNMGVEFYQQRSFAKAVSNFRQAHRLEPENATIRINLANAYQAHAGDLAEKEKFTDAIASLEKALPLNAEDARPLLQLGAYFLHENMVQDAIFRLEEAIELAPEDVDAHFLLGEAYYKDNDASAALEHWEWVQGVEPDRPGLSDRMITARREDQVEKDFGDRASRHFHVTYAPEADTQLVRQVLTILEAAYRDIGRTLGHTYPPGPIQVSLYTLEEFSEAAQVDQHVGAIYDGNKIRCPVFDAEGEVVPRDELRRRLYHEYVHVIVQRLGKNRVPWWLNEGLAETFSRELGQDQIQLLQTAREKDYYFSLGQISDSQLDRLDTAQLTIAYRQSHATVAYLKKRFGVRRFSQLLKALGEGEDPEKALRSTFRYGYKTLELAVADFIDQG